jgi:hypothetical protein
VLAVTYFVATTVVAWCVVGSGGTLPGWFPVVALAAFLL